MQSSDSKNLLIRSTLLVALYWLRHTDRPNSEIDAAFNVYDRVKDDMSAEANDMLGRAIYGGEWVCNK